jgi:hypothetical protein
LPAAVVPHGKADCLSTVNEEPTTQPGLILCDPVAVAIPADEEERCFPPRSRKSLAAMQSSRQHSRHLQAIFLTNTFFVWIAGAAFIEEKILSFFAAPAWHKARVAR